MHSKAKTAALFPHYGYLKYRSLTPKSLDSIIIDIISNIVENAIEQLDNAIGENLRRLRLAQGMTLDALGDVSGVSRAMISRIERGETSPTA